MNRDLEDYKAWLHAVSVQIDRIKISFAEHLVLVKRNDRKTISIRSGYLTNYSETSVQLWTDIHFLYIALNHLLVCSELKGVKKVVKNPFDIKAQEIFENLRHIFEHWDKTRVVFERNLNKTEAAKWYSENYPKENPWSISLDDNGFIISGILDVNELQTHITSLEEELARIYPKN